MIVDPFTGQPIPEEGEPVTPQSVVGAAGQSFMTDPNSVGYAVMGNLPGLTTMVGWNMARGQNTIMGRGAATGIGSRQGWKASVFNTTSPSRMFRLPGPESVFTGSPGQENYYTPFNAAASIGNTAAKFAAGRESMSKLVERGLTGTGVTAADIAGGRATLFDGGTLARLGVARRLADMDRGNLSPRDQRRLANTATSLNRVGLIGSVKPGRAAEEVLRSFKGVHTQRLAGHLGGMMQITNLDAGIGRGSSLYDDAFAASRATMRTGAAAIGVDANDVLKAKTFKSASMAFQGMRAGNTKFATSMAGKAAFMGGSKAIPVLGQILLARDVMAMGSAVIKKGAEFSRDAAKSFQGQIQKPIFGMGYKDNAVNATSRARGLTAIQSSRLNARNALGNEAGMLANHYG